MMFVLALSADCNLESDFYLLPYEAPSLDYHPSPNTLFELESLTCVPIGLYIRVVMVIVDGHSLH
jgi:hypothetical protein